MASIEVYVCPFNGCHKVFYEKHQADGHRGTHFRKAPPLKEVEHGTPRGARMHRKRGEMPCSACKMAWRIYIRLWRTKKGG